MFFNLEILTPENHILGGPWGPSLSEKTPVLSEETPALSEETPALSEKTPILSEKTPSQALEKHGFFNAWAQAMAPLGI